LGRLRGVTFRSILCRPKGAIEPAGLPRVGSYADFVARIKRHAVINATVRVRAALVPMGIPLSGAKGGSEKKERER